jgi:hypothetical protein
VWGVESNAEAAHCTEMHTAKEFERIIELNTIRWGDKVGFGVAPCNRNVNGWARGTVAA